MIWIVVDLHLRAGPIRIGGRFADTIENAAVGAFGDFPIEREFEVFELFSRDQVGAFPFDALENAFFASPVRREGLLMEAAKGVGNRFAIVENNRRRASGGGTAREKSRDNCDGSEKSSAHDD